MMAIRGYFHWPIVSAIKKIMLTRSGSYKVSSNIIHDGANKNRTNTPQSNAAIKNEQIELSRCTLDLKLRWTELPRQTLGLTLSILELTQQTIELTLSITELTQQTIELTLCTLELT